MRARRSLLIWLIVIAVGAAVTHGVREYQRASRGAPWIATPAGATLTGRARAIDGDSLEIARVNIRLAGIDAPEARQECRDRAGESYPCGREAARALAAAVAGRTITCTAVDHDRYDRDIALCTVDGRDLVGTGDTVFGPEEGARVLAARPPRADLAPDHDLPDDTRLWAALQHVGGGTWGGCVYDVDAIASALRGSPATVPPSSR